MPLCKHTYGRPGYIYVLVDPRDNTVVYVGQTVRPHGRKRDHARGNYHRKHTNHRLKAWKDEIKAAGLQWRFEIVETINADVLNVREGSWIRYYRTLGDIFNLKDVPLLLRKKKKARHCKPERTRRFKAQPVRPTLAHPVAAAHTSSGPVRQKKRKLFGIDWAESFTFCTQM